MNSYKDNDMELCKEVLIHAIQESEMLVFFPGLHVDAAEIVKLKCYQVLNEIKAIIKDDSLNDEECFMKIEKIVCALESVGSNGGNRHDFG